jgi:hypothetical protein
MNKTQNIEIDTQLMATIEAEIACVGKDSQLTSEVALPDTDRQAIVPIENLLDAQAIPGVMLFNEQKKVFFSKTEDGILVMVDADLYLKAPLVYREIPEWWILLSEKYTEA